MGQKEHVTASLRRMLEMRAASPSSGSSPDLLKALLGDVDVSPGIVVSAHAERGSKAEISASLDFADLILPGAPLTLEASASFNLSSLDAVVLTLTRFPPSLPRVSSAIGVACLTGAVSDFGATAAFEAGFSASLKWDFPIDFSSAGKGGYTFQPDDGGDDPPKLAAGGIKLEAKATLKATAGVQYTHVACRDMSPLCYPNVHDADLAVHLDLLLGHGKREVKDGVLAIFDRRELALAGRELKPTKRFYQRSEANVMKTDIVAALEKLRAGIVNEPGTFLAASQDRDTVVALIDEGVQALDAFYGYSVARQSFQAIKALALRENGSESPADRDARLARFQTARATRRGYSCLLVSTIMGFVELGMEVGGEVTSLGIDAALKIGGKLAGKKYHRTSYRHQSVGWASKEQRRAPSAPPAPDVFVVMTQDTVIRYLSNLIEPDFEVERRLMIGTKPIYDQAKKLGHEAGVTEGHATVGGREVERTKTRGAVNEMDVWCATAVWNPPPLPTAAPPPRLGLAGRVGAKLESLLGRGTPTPPVVQSVSLLPGSGISRSQSVEVEDLHGAVHDPGKALELAEMLARTLAVAPTAIDELLTAAKGAILGLFDSTGEPTCSAVLVEAAKVVPTGTTLEATYTDVKGAPAWVLGDALEPLKGGYPTAALESLRLRVRESDLVTANRTIFRPTFRLGAEKNVEGADAFALTDVHDMGVNAVIDVYTYYPGRSLAQPAPVNAAGHTRGDETALRIVRERRAKLILGKYDDVIDTKKTPAEREAAAKGIEVYIAGFEGMDAGGRRAAMSRAFDGLTGRSTKPEDFARHVDVAARIREISTRLVRSAMSRS